MDDINYIQEIKTIFEDYFGEDKVDLQDSYTDNIKNILVHFPSVIVTNENHKSEVIYDLFAKIQVHTSGRIEEKFKLARTTYTKRQALSGYTHSHVPRSTMLGEFANPCLGSGPLNSTIFTLGLADTPWEERKTFWELFCRELDEYTQVESLKGGPYIRLETIGSGEAQKANFICTLNSCWNINTTFAERTASVALQILNSGMLKFGFDGTNFTIGMSDTDFAILATNAAYQYEKSRTSLDPKSETFLDAFTRKYKCTKYILNQGVLCQICYNYNSHRISNEPIVFKGETIPVRILNNTDENDNHIILVLSLEDLIVLKTYILYYANAIYGKSITPEDAIFL